MTGVRILMVSYNAEKTLARTYSAIPEEFRRGVLLVDDASTDRTVALAKELGLAWVAHSKNRGYGASQKTGFDRLLGEGAQAVVILHADYQYDPGRIPELLRPIEEGKADAVLGSRMLDGLALKGGMPLWKYAANRVSTGIANAVYGMHLSEYHTGLRAYRRRVLEDIPYRDNSDRYAFDIQMLRSLIAGRYRIAEIPVTARYFKEASSIGFLDSLAYGWAFLQCLFRPGSRKQGVPGGGQ